MIPRRLHLIFLVFLFTSSCIPQQATFKKPLIEEGEVILYLQPMPQEADKLRLVIGAISAIRADGNQIPLTLSFNELNGPELVGRQTMLATGILPPGSYTGIAIQVKKASVQTEEGEVALLVPEEPVNASKLFAIERRKALALFLTAKPSGLISSVIRFTPSFSLATPGRPLINLTGYVSNSASNLISVFNKKTMQVVNAIATGRRPTGLALDQRRTRAFVAIAEDDAIEVFDVFSGRNIGRIRVSFGDNPVDLALTPDGRTLVSANYDSNTVSIIDAISMVEIERITVGEGPTSAVIDRSGFKAYILNSLSSTVSVVDLTQRTIIVTISVEGTPLDGVFNQAGDEFYLITRDTPNLVVIDTSQFTVPRTIFIGPGAASLTVDFRTGLILVGKRFGGGIVVADPATQIFIDTIRVEGKVVFMTTDRQENSLFVVLPDRGLVQKINLTSKKIMAEIEVSQGAYQAIVMGES